MNCARCGRRLRTATVTITTRSAAMNYGPKCSRLMGLIEPRKERRPRKALPPKIVRRYMSAHTRDPRQMELMEALT